jgi:hypothetical protein
VYALFVKPAGVRGYLFLLNFLGQHVVFLKVVFLGRCGVCEDVIEWRV